VQRRALLMLSIVCVFAGVRALRAQVESRKFKPEEIDQLLAPIALYPDALLSQVLMAAGYPLEVVEAARWSKAYPAYKGEAALNAVKDKDWDASVKSLVAFPSVLLQMDHHLDWTQKLGDAMISQEQDVADSVQRLRARAAAAGNLQSTPQQTVTTEGSGDNVQYVIAPADPQIVYVPSYNPSWVYGAWPYPAYPPVYYPMAGALATGFFWGVGLAAAGALFGGWNWAGHGNSYVNVNVNRAVNIDRNFDRTRINANGAWQHNPDHRRGVGYRDPGTRQKYGQGPRPGADQRQQFRGRLEGNVGANRPQVAPRGEVGPSAGARPNLGQQRPAAQNRANAQRPTAVSGVNRGQQVNREAQRGQAQMTRARSHPNFQGSRAGGGARAGGGRR
jgi:hypothetical protein